MNRKELTEKGERNRKVASVLQETNDCAVRALAMACHVSYEKAWTTLHLCGRKEKCGTPWRVIQEAVDRLGFELVDVTKLFSGKTVRTVARELELFSGSFLIDVQRHVLPVVEGELYDWSKGRCFHVLRVLRVREKSVGRTERVIATVTTD